MFKELLNYFRYEKELVDVQRMTKFPDGVEVDLDSFLQVTSESTEKPKAGQWIPVGKYYLTEKDSVLSLNIASKYKYTPKDSSKKAVAFLNPNPYKLISGTLVLRRKRNINWASVSIIISLMSLALTILNYYDRVKDAEFARNEIQSAKSPVWLVKYEAKDNSLYFKSPLSDIQLQNGFLQFPKSGKDIRGHLYMPDMKFNLDSFDELVKQGLEKFPREKYGIIFGDGRIFQTFAIAATYTYRGEVLRKGSIYKLFFDSKIPSLKQGAKKPEVIIRGVEFVRFLNEDESLVSGLKNVNWNETTEHQDWIKLLSEE